MVLMSFANEPESEPVTYDNVVNFFYVVNDDLSAHQSCNKDYSKTFGMALFKGSIVEAEGRLIQDPWFCIYFLGKKQAILHGTVHYVLSVVHEGTCLELEHKWLVSRAQQNPIVTLKKLVKYC